MSDVIFTNIKTDSFAISWEPPYGYLDHVSSYKVTMSPDIGQSITVQQDSMSAMVTGLTAGQVYQVTVSTINSVTQLGTPRTVAKSKEQATSKSFAFRFFFFFFFFLFCFFFHKSFITLVSYINFSDKMEPASMAQLDAPSDWRTGGHGFNPCRGSNILPWRLIVKYFLRSFSPFR